MIGPRSSQLVCLAHMHVHVACRPAPGDVAFPSFGCMGWWWPMARSPWLCFSTGRKLGSVPLAPAPLQAAEKKCHLGWGTVVVKGESSTRSAASSAQHATLQRPAPTITQSLQRPAPPSLSWLAPPIPAGIMANFLVCLAVWLANSSRDFTGKVRGHEQFSSGHSRTWPVEAGALCHLTTGNSLCVGIAEARLCRALNCPPLRPLPAVCGHLAPHQCLCGPRL